MEMKPMNLRREMRDPLLFFF